MSAKNELNDAQREAVGASDGPICIIAGPGTGKTKTLTARIAYLVGERNVSAQHILALTFTNKAAKAMRERVLALLPSKQAPLITTFHAFCLQVLAEQQEKPPVFVTNQQRHSIITSLKKSGMGKGISARDLSLGISRAKNMVKPPDDPVVQHLVEAYNLELSQQNLWDFDDVLQHAYRLLDEDEPVRLRLQRHYQHILVDEFQDTNDIQYGLVNLLSPSGNLFVIGDPLQSIYGFRGADAAVFDRFKRDWPTTRSVTLTINYRSTPEIVQLANASFPDSPALEAHTAQAGTVQAVEVLNEYSEAQWVIDHIERELGGSNFLKSSQHHTSAQKRTFQDFAVLYRTHATARVMQRNLEESGIPYQVVGEGSPYHKPHIESIISTLAYLADDGELPPIKGMTISQVRTLLEPLKASQTDLTLSQVVSEIIKLFAIDKPERCRDIQQLMHTLLRFDEQPISKYLEYVRSLAEQEFYDSAAEAVTLLTIHAAKGLEFSRIFLIGIEQGILPLIRDTNQGDIAEERRLFYVAVTRAREELDIIYTRHRAGKPAQPSAFITGLSSGVLPRMIDPQMAIHQHKATIHKQKRAQTHLF